MSIDTCNAIVRFIGQILSPYHAWVGVPLGLRNHYPSAQPAGIVFVGMDAGTPQIPQDYR